MTGFSQFSIFIFFFRKIHNFVIKINLILYIQKKCTQKMFILQSKKSLFIFVQKKYDKTLPQKEHVYEYPIFNIKHLLSYYEFNFWIHIIFLYSIKSVYKCVHS